MVTTVLEDGSDVARIPWLGAGSLLTSNSINSDRLHINRLYMVLIRTACPLHDDNAFMYSLHV